MRESKMIKCNSVFEKGPTDVKQSQLYYVINC